MDLIDRIGAVLGLAAFLGLAVLAMLYFQQARDVRRLREWAGKAPERAAAAAQQAGTLPSEPDTGETDAGFLTRVGAGVRSVLARIGAPIAAAWGTLDRRSPIDPRVLVPVLAIAAVAAVVVLAHPFGLLGGNSEVSGGSGGQHGTPSPDQVEVAVLNGTSPGVTGLANTVAQKVKSAGYKVGQVGDATTPFTTSVVMFEPQHKAEAKALADAMKADLGATGTQPMTSDIRTLAGGASVALVVGQDDAQG